MGKAIDDKLAAGEKKLSAEQKAAEENASHAKAVMDKIDKDAAAAKAKLDGKIASEKKANAKEADAKKAKAHAKEVNVKDAATEVKTKAKTKEISHKDGEIGMCNGHQCQGKDGKCYGVLPY